MAELLGPQFDHEVGPKTLSGYDWDELTGSAELPTGANVLASAHRVQLCMRAAAVSAAMWAGNLTQAARCVRPAGGSQQGCIVARGYSLAMT